ELCLSSVEDLDPLLFRFALWFPILASRLRQVSRGALKHLEKAIKAKDSSASCPIIYPETKWQRCVFHSHQNILPETSPTKRKEVAAMWKVIYAKEDVKTCRQKAEKIAIKPEGMKL